MFSWQNKHMNSKIVKYIYYLVVNWCYIIFQTLLSIFISLTVKVGSSIKSQYYGLQWKSDRTQFLKGDEYPHCQLNPLQIFLGEFSKTPNDISATSICTEETTFNSSWAWQAGSTMYLERRNLILSTLASTPKCTLL